MTNENKIPDIKDGETEKEYLERIGMTKEEYLEKNKAEMAPIIESVKAMKDMSHEEYMEKLREEADNKKES